MGAGDLNFELGVRQGIEESVSKNRRVFLARDTSLSQSSTSERRKLILRIMLFLRLL